MATDRLAKAAVTGAKFTGKPRKLSDGGGLFLHVTASGKYWRLAYRFDGKQKLLALGVWPSVELTDARDKRDEARRGLAKGIDPGAQRKAAKAKRKAATRGDGTFEAVAREWVEQVHQHRVVPAHAHDNLRRLELHVFPRLGRLPVDEVTAPQLLEVLRDMERAAHPHNAHRVRTLCGQVFRYAIATARAERDPAADLRDTLQAHKQGHHAALTDPAELAPLLRAIEAYPGEPATRAALKLSALLFTRPGELRAATWDAFDLDAGTWDFQPSKGGAPLVTPLPRQAVEILRDLHRLTGPEGRVFPSARGADRPLSESALRLAFLAMGYGGKMTPHGFRATARTLLVERLDFPAEWVEQQLGHAVRDANGRAYNRTTFLEQRKEMLQKWADYLDRLRAGVSLAEVAA